ncbi:DNA methyltransferase [Arsenophonus sp. PmNCSU2021_1]|uniref:DNA methyltransferase n=1 Tax=Arsenophonus sp. PmNCSU2021_1 TaxID=3118989 RepID=UPI002FF30497
MSRFIQDDSLKIMSTFPDNAIDFILTDPPYLVDYTDRSGRSIANDNNDEWLKPACQQMFRVLKPNSLMVSFYGWNRVDKFVDAWKKSGFRIVGHLVFKKRYASKTGFLEHSHENAYLLAKGRPVMPVKPMRDVQSWQYTGNLYHPTQKPISSLQPLIESFTQPNAIVLDPFAGSGSTCIAAALSGRRYIGIELLAEYHAIGQQRIAALRTRLVA